MDFALRCNNLKCRAQLTDRAVVTTCSHIFCSACSQNLGLDAASSGQRTCPACETSLPNPDDVVSTQLNPSEDYKTSVLSGFTPSLQMDREKLQSENTSLVAAFREKSRKHQQTQELYDRLKRKEMTAATQSAAFKSVDEVLSGVTGRSGQSRPSQQSFIPRPQGQQDLSQYQYDIGQDLGHQREGSNGSGASGGMVPPLLRRPTVFGSHLFGTMNLDDTRQAAELTCPAGNNGNTPSQHRTQLGPQMQHAHLQGSSRNASHFTGGMSQGQTPLQRLPLGTMSGSSVNKSNISNYGMSAGMKVGRQQGSRLGVS
ncbi:MAG: hypothetical protein Q9218_003930 [Villophora microphyllina]